MKSKSLFLFFVCLCISITNVWSQSGKSVAYQDKQVRFTVIADGVIRMEWSKDGNFVDSPSFVAVNREYAPVDYKIKDGNRWVEITTNKMALKYTKGSGRFTDENIKITSAKSLGTPFVWTPGIKQKANLKGTYRTLDGYDGEYHDGRKMPLEDGLLAKDGWTCIDDSNNFLFDNSEWPWVERRKDSEAQDIYFMAYGHNYKQALKDYTSFAGKVPLPPRYAFGYWWSRYWSYSDNELRDLVDRFHTYNIPLDVLVVDMDWHYTEKGKGGWTGYTWNRKLFPEPDRFLKYLKENNLQITLNLHPADGIASYEEKYLEMAKLMGVDTASHATIPFAGSDKKFMDGWLNRILKPMNDAGVDFWWLDWQQWLEDKAVKGLNNTWWINYVVFSNMQRNFETRPMLYHRWGGLGNHRYQIGFSGDSFISWKSLDFQPYFNSTASNVLYGYWSHDIGGHMGADSIEPELFTRWMQFGALSPVMRTHSTKNAGLNKEPWVFNDTYFQVLRNTILQRYQMAPYIYSMARDTYENGVSLCRPMYYDYPESTEAYDFKNEYMFGDGILVAPITAPMKDGYSKVKVWLPEGADWYEWHTGTMLTGGQIVERNFAIDEYPVYIKAGSVLPFYGNVQNLRSNDEEIHVTVFPGDNGSFTMYEDGGNDKEYEKNYATTLLESSKSGNEQIITIAARKGGYKGMPQCRKFKIDMPGAAVPSKITVNGSSVEYSYDGNRQLLSIDLPLSDALQEKVITITYPADAIALNDGLVGKFRRIQRSITALKYKDAGIVLNDGLGTMESAGRKISYNPEKLNDIIGTFRADYARLPEILKEQNLDEAVQKWFLNSIDWSK